MPAIGSSAVIAFLASFENYNTTVFSILSEQTLTTVIASKVRLGISPAISALALVIIILTLIAAIFIQIGTNLINDLYDFILDLKISVINSSFVGP